MSINLGFAKKSGIFPPWLTLERAIKCFVRKSICLFHLAKEKTSKFILSSGIMLQAIFFSYAPLCNCLHYRIQLLSSCAEETLLVECQQKFDLRFSTPALNEIKQLCILMKMLVKSTTSACNISYKEKIVSQETQYRFPDLSQTISILTQLIMQYFVRRTLQY